MSQSHEKVEAQDRRYVYEVALVVTQRVHGRIAFAVDQPLTEEEGQVVPGLIRHSSTLLRASVWQDPFEEPDLISFDVGLPKLLRREAGDSSEAQEPLVKS
jgi:hypothetical protein